MQTVNSTDTVPTQAVLPPVSEDFCQMEIFADDELYFNVRVTCGNRRFVAGGFMNPDQAHRKGLAAMLAMHQLSRKR